MSCAWSYVESHTLTYHIMWVAQYRGCCVLVYRNGGHCAMEAFALSHSRLVNFMYVCTWHLSKVPEAVCICAPFLADWTVDHSRVILKVPDENGCDYINASYINVSTIVLKVISLFPEVVLESDCPWSHTQASYCGSLLSGMQGYVQRSAYIASQGTYVPDARTNMYTHINTQYIRVW